MLTWVTTGLCVVYVSFIPLVRLCPDSEKGLDKNPRNLSGRNQDPSVRIVLKVFGHDKSVEGSSRHWDQ